MATTSAAMNAIALLKADHRAVEALFEKYESTNGAKAKEKIARQICRVQSPCEKFPRALLIRQVAARAVAALSRRSSSGSLSCDVQRMVLAQGQRRLDVGARPSACRLAATE